MEDRITSAHCYKTDSNSYRALMMMLRRQMKTKSDKASRKAIADQNVKEPVPAPVPKKDRRKKGDADPGGLLASLYLDCFLVYSRKMCADSVVLAGLCEKGKFTDWRNEQRSLGNLDWDISLRWDKTPEYNYKPGSKLMKHLDKVSKEHNLHASKGYVDQKIEEVESRVDAKIAALQGILKTVLDKFDPPGDEAKCDDYIKNPDKMLRLINSQK